jgi:autotransporter-associated beta strand protein
MKEKPCIAHTGLTAQLRGDSPNNPSRDGTRGKSVTPRRGILGAVVSFAALALFQGMSCQESKAALMAYEGFSYTTGSGNMNGQNGGFGWNGSWQTVNNGASSVQGGSLTAGANAPTGYDPLSIGNSVSTPNNTRTGRRLDTSAGGSFAMKGYVDGNGNIGMVGKTLYISFMQQPNGTTSYYEFEFHRGDLGDPGRVGGVGNDSGANTDVYLRVPSAGQTSIGAGSTSVNFYVVRIDFLGGNDTVTVYQNPTSASEPATATLTLPGAGDMSFNGISFGCFNNGRTVAHDEIRVGETWADVTSPGIYSAGIWDGGGANNNWSTVGNWDNNVLPVFPVSLTFAGNTRLTNTNDISGISAQSITFSSTAGAFNLKGNNLGLNGNIGFSANPASPITQIISLPLTPAADFAIDTRTNGNISVNGDITATGQTLTQSSPGNSGTLTLAGNNTVAGFIVNGGTNRITGSTTIAGTGGTRFCLANANTTFNGTLVIENGASLSVIGSFVDAGVIGRDGGIGTVIQNGGTFSFTMDNQDYLFVGAAGNPNGRGIYNMNGGVLDMNGEMLGLGLGDHAAVTGIVNQVSGVITNVGQLYFSPFFTTGYGIYNLSGGSIYIGANGIIAFPGSSYQINLGGGTVGALTSWSSALNMTLTGLNGPVTFNPAGNSISLSGVLSGSGGLTLSGGGTLILSGANTYTGDTIVNAGNTLQWDATGSSAGAIRLANGAFLNLNYSGASAVGSLYTNGVALPVGTYNAGNLPGFITGFGDLQVSSGISTGRWTGLGANNNWSTAANWDNNAVPIFPRAVTFAGNNRLSPLNDLSSLTLSSLTFDSAAGAFTLGGNDVTLNGAIGFNGNPAAPVTQTVNFGMMFTDGQTINLPANGNLTLGGNITSGDSLVKAGAGTLTLGGASDFFSGYTIAGGTNILTGNITITGNGPSRFYIGDIGTVGTTVIQPGATLSVVGDYADAGVLGRDSGSGSVIQNGGTFSFNPNNQGFLFIGASSSAATRAEYHMNGGTLDLNNLTLAVALSANSSTLITGLVDQVSGTIANVGKLDLGALTFGPGRGIYNLRGGSIYIGGGGIVSDSGVYNLNLGGGTVGAYTSWSSSLNMTLTGSNGPVTFDTVGNVITLTGILSGPGGLNVTGGGVVELGGANTFTGDMTVNAGTLQLDVAGSSSGALRVANGTFVNLNFSGNFVISGFSTNGVPLPNGTYSAANMPAFITGPGNLLVQGVSSGRWTGIGANNNWSTAANWDHNALPIFPIGLTFAGSARLNNNNDLTDVSATSITFDSAASAFTLSGNSLGLNGSIAFNGNPATPITQTINLALMSSADVNVDTPANGNLVINGNIASTNNTLYKVGGGTLVMNGNNTFAGFDVDGGTNVIMGNTTVSGTGGTRAYVANGDYVGGSVGTLVIQNGATFAFNGSFGDAYVIGRDTGVGRLVQNGGVFDYNPANQNNLFIGAGNNPSTRGQYDMNGGILNLNGKTLGIALGVNVAVTGVVNQVSGVITNVGQILFDPFFTTGHGIYNLSGGSLYIGSGGITVQPGGSYEINLGGGTIGASAGWSSSLDMTLTGNNGPVTFNPGGNTILLSGVLSGTGGLTVSGAGTLELSGENTYTGTTLVNQGTLKLDSANNSSSAIKLASGTSLNLNFTGTMAIASFYTNNVPLPVGTYNAGNLPGFITGTGSLQVSGSIATTPTNITFSAGGGFLTLSWPANYQGWVLQQQTNPLNVGLGTNWVDVPGSAGMNSVNIPINPAAPVAFYRLHYPTP